MTHRLLVNPETPQAWEIQLKPGLNRIGRGEQNDFKVAHPSVSTAHCEVVVSSAGALLKDLGSTNGTFINRAKIQEAILQSGQHLQLGAVDMVFESAPVGAAGGLAAAAPAHPAHAVTAAPPIPRPVSSASLRINKPATPEPEPVAHAPATHAHAPSVSPIHVGKVFCKFHPKTAARFLCQKCQKYYCDLCVTTRHVEGSEGHFCRSCGQALTPVHVDRSAPTGQKGFYARIPGAFLYPFRGFGVVILFLAGFFFGGVDYLKTIGFLSGPFGWIMQAGFYGMLFLFMQNIIHTTAADENESLGFPEMDGLFGAAFQLGITILASFGLALGLLIARLCDVPVPGAAIMAATILGCFYFPMAFLAVAMKDSVMAANPLIVIPAIVKLPLEYLVAAILLLGVFGLRQIGGMMSSMAGATQMSTRDMSVLFIAMAVQALWSLGSIYLLCVTMRILGLLYVTKKHKFGWFDH